MHIHTMCTYASLTGPTGCNATGYFTGTVTFETVMTIDREINANNFTIQFKNDLIGSTEWHEVANLRESSDKVGTLYFYNVAHTMMNKEFNVTMCTYSNVCSNYGKTSEEPGGTGRWILPENKDIDGTYFTSIKNMTFMETSG